MPDVVIVVGNAIAKAAELMMEKIVPTNHHGQGQMVGLGHDDSNLPHEES